jgi:hypothetical protein
MWYLSPSQDLHEGTAPEMIAAAVEPDPRETARGDLKLGALDSSSKAPACSPVSRASTGRGSEYWLP